MKNKVEIFGRKLKRYNFVSIQYLHERAEKNIKNVVKLVYRQDLNTGLPKYETGVVVTTLPRCFVELVNLLNVNKVLFTQLNERLKYTGMWCDAVKTLLFSSRGKGFRDYMAHSMSMVDVG
jgi:hypothetical protein